MADPKQLEILKQGVDAWNRCVQAGDEIDLFWADLRGANLHRAKLQGADCRTVINDAGEREFTDLSETEGLTQEQLESMRGDRWVIIPDDLTYPEDWPEPPESEVVPEQPEGPFVFISYAQDNKREVAEITRYLALIRSTSGGMMASCREIRGASEFKPIWKTVRRFLGFGPSRACNQKVSLRRPKRGKARASCSMPSWVAQLPYGFGEVQYADLTDWARQSDRLESLRLIEALRQKLDPDDANVRQQLRAASDVEFTARNGMVTLGNKPLNTPPTAHNPKDLDDLRTASIDLIKNIRADFFKRKYNFDVDALNLRLSQYANVLREKTDNWYNYEDAVRRIKSMKDEAGEESWGDSLIIDITALFERHEKMRKYLQPAQPPAGTPGAIGPAPLASGTADAAAIGQQWQEAIFHPKMSDIADAGVTEYFKDLDADLK